MGYFQRLCLILLGLFWLEISPVWAASDETPAAIQMRIKKVLSSKAPNRATEARKLGQILLLDRFISALIHTTPLYPPSQLESLKKAGLVPAEDLKLSQDYHRWLETSGFIPSPEVLLEIDCSDSQGQLAKLYKHNFEINLYELLIAQSHYYYPQSDFLKKIKSQPLLAEFNFLEDKDTEIGTFRYERYISQSRSDFLTDVFLSQQTKAVLNYLKALSSDYRVLSDFGLTSANNMDIDSGPGKALFASFQNNYQTTKIKNLAQGLSLSQAIGFQTLETRLHLEMRQKLPTNPKAETLRLEKTQIELNKITDKQTRTLKQTRIAEQYCLNGDFNTCQQLLEKSIVADIFPSSVFALELWKEVFVKKTGNAKQMLQKLKSWSHFKEPLLKKFAGKIWASLEEDAILQKISQQTDESTLLPLLRVIQKINFKSLRVSFAAV